MCVGRTTGDVEDYVDRLAFYGLRDLVWSEDLRGAKLSGRCSVFRRASCHVGCVAQCVRELDDHGCDAAAGALNEDGRVRNGGERGPGFDEEVAVGDEPGCADGGEVMGVRPLGNVLGTGMRFEAGSHA